MKGIRILLGGVLFLGYLNFGFSQCNNPDDYTALRALYLSTDGDNWTNNTGWPTAADFNANSSPQGGTDISGWYGVECNGAERVTELNNLWGNNLSGTLPSELGGLSFLTILFLQNNNLSGIIPPELGNLTNLEFLRLNVNNLSGPIPPELETLNQLTELQLNDNNLSGIIPSELGMLSNLNSLSLSFNNFNNSIPPELGNITGLTSLRLQQSNVIGEIPSELGNISNLLILELQSNNLEGCIPNNLQNLCDNIVNGNLGNNLNLDTESWTNFCNNQEGICQACPTEYTITYPEFLCLGESFDFQIELIGGDGPFDITVTDGISDYGSLSGVTGTSFTIPAIDPANGLYTFNITITDNGNPCPDIIRSTSSTGVMTMQSGGFGLEVPSMPVCFMEPYDLTISVTPDPSSNPPYMGSVTETPGGAVYSNSSNTEEIIISIPAHTQGMYDYSGAVLDNNGCAYFGPFFLSGVEVKAEGISDVTLPFDPTCEEEPYQIRVDVLNGNPPYQIELFENSSFINSQTVGNMGDASALAFFDINNQTEGIYGYTITITDQQSCSYQIFYSSDNHTVLPTPVIENIGPIQACQAEQNEQITIDLTQYNDAISSGNTISWNLESDGSLPITDPSNFQTSASTIIYVQAASIPDGCLSEYEPIQILITQSALSIDCDVNENNVTIIVDGASLPYDISWNGITSGNEFGINESSYTISDLFSGEYTIEVMDAQGCMISCDVNISQNGNCPHPDVPTLLNLYSATNGENWDIDSGWINGDTNCDPCDKANSGINPWHGIICDFQNERVTEIELIDNNLTGNIILLSGLDSLERIVLSDNDIRGGNWNFDNPKLRVIAIGGNSGLKTTLPDFNLPLLEEVYTYGDSLNGPLPQWKNVPNLRDAYIYDNPYNDTIPDWGLDSLKNLSLYNCGLTGDLPSLENSTKLFSFYVDDNGLEGEIPEYTDKTELDTLVLRNNNLSGCVDIERYCGIGWFTAENNPLLPYSGDTDSLCMGLEQVGAECDDDDESTINDMIQADCSCVGESDGEMLPFVTTWVTDNPGITGDSSIRVPTFPGETYNYEVDWYYVMGTPFVADTAGITGDFEYNFGKKDTVTIAIRGVFSGCLFNNMADKEKLINIDQWGECNLTSLRSAYYGCSNLRSTAIDAPNLDGVTDMSSCFTDCEIFDGNLNEWNVSNVTNMDLTFSGCSSFNSELNNWMVLNVLTMRRMFQNCISFNQPLNRWQVTEVTDMQSMFSGCTNFNQDLDPTYNSILDYTSWDVSNVTNMNLMFFQCINFNGNIDNWNVQNVQTSIGMFNECRSFAGNLSLWNVGENTDMRGMFWNCIAFNGEISNWNVSKVTNMISMFNGCELFNNDIGNWDVRATVDMSQMFRNASNFDQDLGRWEIQNVEKFNSTLQSDTFGIFDNSGLSCPNYSATLKGWSENENTPNGLQMQALGMTYNSLGKEGRDDLEAKGWTIAGDTLDSDCGSPCSSPICKNQTNYLVLNENNSSISLSQILDDDFDIQDCYSFDPNINVDTLPIGCNDVCTIQDITVYNLETGESCTTSVRISKQSNICEELNNSKASVELIVQNYTGGEFLYVDLFVNEFVNVVEYSFDIGFDSDLFAYEEATDLNIELETRVRLISPFATEVVNVIPMDEFQFISNINSPTKLATLSFRVINEPLCESALFDFSLDGFGNALFTCENINGLVDTDYINATFNYVFEKPIFSPQPLEICNGDEITVSITNSDSYQSINWDNSTTDELTVSPNISTIYNLIIEDIRGCTLDTFVNIDVVEELEVIVSGGDLCDSNPQILTASGSYAGYSWTKDSVPLSSTESSITIIESGNYRVIVTDENGCTGSTSIFINNNNSPTLALTNTTIQICNNSSEGNTIIDLSIYDVDTINFSTNVNINTSDLSNLNFNNQPLDQYLFTFFTTNAIAPCENDSIQINIEVIECSDCGIGGCLSINPPQFINLPNLDSEVFDCMEDVPEPFKLKYSNITPTDCEESGEIMAIRNMSNLNECQGTITDTWTYTSLCGISLDTSVTFTVNSPGTLKFDNPPAESITISCNEASSQNPLTIDYSFDLGSSCIPMGEVSPTIIEDYNECGGTITYNWTVMNPCGTDLSFTQIATIASNDDFQFFDPPVDITISCSQLTFLPDTLLITNNAEGACAVFEEIKAITVEVSEDCPGQIINVWTFDNPCTGEQISHEQRVTLVDCAAATLKEDYIEVRAGNIYDIDLFENDIVPDSLSTRITDIERKELFFANEYSTNGLFEFAISESFFDTITITYEVCNLECDNCTTNNLQIVDEALKDIILTDIMTPNSDGRNDVLRFNFESEIEGSQLYIYNRWGDKIFEQLGYANDWDASGYPGGVYFYVLRIGDATVKKTLTVVK